MTNHDSIPTNVKDLTALVITQREQLSHQSLFIDQLLEQIKLAKHHRFGVKSEHISPDHLPRVEIEHTLGDEACRCQHCCSTLEPISQKITEQLDIIPAQVRVIHHVRQTYQCDACEDALTTTPLPPQPIPKSNATPSTLTYLIIAKYLEGMPLYRLERQLARYGMPVPRATLASWMIQCGQLVQPLINLMRDWLLSYDIIAMDESRYQVLKEVGKTAQSQYYIWVQRRGPPDSPIIIMIMTLVDRRRCRYVCSMASRAICNQMPMKVMALCVGKTN